MENVAGVPRKHNHQIKCRRVVSRLFYHSRSALYGEDTPGTDNGDLVGAAHSSVRDACSASAIQAAMGACSPEVAFAELPPMRPPFSIKITGAPARDASIEAARPAKPPPTTTTGSCRSDGKHEKKGSL